MRSILKNSSEEGVLRLTYSRELLKAADISTMETDRHDHTLPRHTGHEILGVVQPRESANRNSSRSPAYTEAFRARLRSRHVGQSPAELLSAARSNSSCNRSLILCSMAALVWRMYLLSSRPRCTCACRKRAICQHQQWQQHKHFKQCRTQYLRRIYIPFVAVRRSSCIHGRTCYRLARRGFLVWSLCRPQRLSAALDHPKDEHHDVLAASRMNRPFRSLSIE